MYASSDEVRILLAAIADAAHNYALAWDMVTAQWKHATMESELMGDLETLEETIRAYRACQETRSRKEAL